MVKSLNPIHCIKYKNKQYVVLTRFLCQMQVLAECRETKISRIETNNDCIQTIKTATTTTTTEKKDSEPTFQFNVLNEQRSDREVPAEVLCLGDYSTTR